MVLHIVGKSICSSVMPHMDIFLGSSLYRAAFSAWTTLAGTAYSRHTGFLPPCSRLTSGLRHASLGWIQGISSPEPRRLWAHSHLVVVPTHAQTQIVLGPDWVLASVGLSSGSFNTCSPGYRIIGTRSSRWLRSRSTSPRFWKSKYVLEVQGCHFS